MEFVERWVTRVDLVSGPRCIWWGRDALHEDFVGTSSGRVASPATVDAPVAFVRSQGWNGIAHTDVGDDARLDLRPAQTWLRSGGTLDAASAVDRRPLPGRRGVTSSCSRDATTRRRKGLHGGVSPRNC